MKRQNYYYVALLCASKLALAQDPSVFKIQKSPNPDVHGNALTAVSAASPTDAWAVGFQDANSSFNNGARTLIEHFDGTSWQATPSPNPNPGHCSSAGFELNGVFALTSTNAWAVGSQNVNATCTSLINPLIVHWNGSAWTVSQSPALQSSGNNNLNGVIAFSGNNAYAVGYQTGPLEATVTLVEHWDGNKWSVIPSPNANSTGNVLSGVTGSGPKDIWAVGNQVAPNVPVKTLTEHFDGHIWKVVPSPNPLESGSLNQNVLLAAAEVTPADVYAVGCVLNEGQQIQETLIEHWDGQAWSVIPSPNVSETQGSINVLTSVAAISGSNIYAFGYFSNAAMNGQPQTLVEHFDGMAWSVVPSPSRPLASQLFGAFASAESNDVWSVGAFSSNGIDPEFGFLQVPQTLVLFSPQP